MGFPALAIAEGTMVGTLRKDSQCEGWSQLMKCPG